MRFVPLFRHIASAALFAALAANGLGAQSTATTGSHSAGAGGTAWPERRVILVLKDDPLDSTIAIVIRASHSDDDEIVIGAAIIDDRQVALAFATWRALVHSGAAQDGANHAVLRTDLQPIRNPTRVSARLTAWATATRATVLRTTAIEDSRFGQVRRAQVELPR